MQGEPNLRDDNEFVDYDEEDLCLQTEQTSLSSQLVNPLSQTVKISSSSHDVAISNLQKSHTTLDLLVKEYIPILTPNLDFEKAKLAIDKKLNDFKKAQCFHSKTPTVEFTMNGLSMLQATYSNLALREKEALFGIMEKLLKHFVNAIYSSLHQQLFTILTDKKLHLFNDDYARAIGITLPQVTSQDTFGTTGLWYIGDEKLRLKTNSELQKFSHDTTLKYEAKLIDALVINASLAYDKFINEFEKRFSSTMDNEVWLKATTIITMTEFDKQGISVLARQEWSQNFANTLKKTLDSLTFFLRTRQS